MNNNTNNTNKKKISDYANADWQKYLRTRVSIDKNTGCWNWTKAIKNKQNPTDRYGVISIRFGSSTKTIAAHRLSYEVFHARSIPNGMCVCHHCDNPSCINPAHLFVGTHADNMNDMYRKGRKVMPRGSASKTSKLKEVDVLRIRFLYSRVQQSSPNKKIHSYKSLARQFGVSKKTIGDIITRKSWTHI